jgi:hypothetical protein
MKSKSALPRRMGCTTRLSALAQLAPGAGATSGPWGAPDRTRPGLPAPRFDRAAFKVRADARELLVAVRVAR